MTILGIDQGSTHTRAAFCNDQGQILGVGFAAGASHTYDGIRVAMLRVQEAIQEAQISAAIESLEDVTVVAGMSGADWPDEPSMLESNLLQLASFKSVHVVNDAIIALRAGTDEPYGAILIGGTAANCAVRSPNSEDYVFGFYHDPSLLGANAITRQALYKIFQVHSYQLPPTLLTQYFLDALQYKDVDELCRNFYEQKVAKVHLLVPLVFKADQEGDWAAHEILAQYGKGSADLIAAGLRRFQMLAMKLEVVVSGSIFKDPNSSLLKTLNYELGQLAPRAKIVNARYEPVVGALLLALESRGIKVDEKIKQNIEDTAARLGLLREI
jgi:N-acetylglucosamine kinase-like BadF-type ATPase